MEFKNVLIANRGEVAIRVIRAANALGIGGVAIHSQDDVMSLHNKLADNVVALPGVGAAAYLDINAVIDAAIQTECDAIHPGYGFLSENATFARACKDAGMTFIGPEPETLDLFGDKSAARALAAKEGVPLLPGTHQETSLEEARAFLEGLGEDGAIMVKALSGGGGRGIRPVHSPADLQDAYEICRTEAQSSFGDGRLYVEKLLLNARHIEIQIAGDGDGAVCHFGDRDCSLQRRRQKVVEIAPAPNLSDALRQKLYDSALTLARAARYKNIGTIEFLVEGDDYYFMEANARLQVEHTVTEAVMAEDLVALQFALAAGETLPQLGLTDGAGPTPRGCAIQLRVNMETMTESGEIRPSGGRLSAFDIPAGPGVRVDTFGYAGYLTNANYDSLLAKVITHGRGYDEAARKAQAALSAFKIEGTDTNIDFLLNILDQPAVKSGETHTGFVDDNVAILVNSPQRRRRYFEAPPAPTQKDAATLNAANPLAILDHGRAGDAGDAGDAPSPAKPDAPEGTSIVAAPMLGSIVDIPVGEGDMVRTGQPVFILEAMKMQHVVAASADGYIRRILAKNGETVEEGQALAFIEEATLASVSVVGVEDIDLDEIRPDLAEVIARQALTQDENRPAAVARRRKTNQRTARENIEDLCDPDSFFEYGSLTLAARRAKHSIDELTRRTPADGLISGLGRVNGDKFSDDAARCMVMSYDYTVLAGTQGKKNHQKKDRMFKLAEKWRLPTIFFAEGGGGRPGDTDIPFAANLHTPAFHLFARLSGLAPLIGITSGRCFAGNAVILGCCDVIIATANSTIGMGGPAMIEGGGLGVFTPEEVGPMSVQTKNGVVDIAVADEAEAVAVAKQYLSYFQGPLEDWECPDQRLLRRVVPEDRLRIYDVRQAINLIADTETVLELRKDFGLGMVTSFIRIEGRPMGVVANNPMHLAGAIDSDGADKAARFIQLCDAYDIPLLFLCDTPGNMVGPEAEKTALVRHCCRLNVIGANVTVPTFTVVLRKAYGLGAQAMAGGGFHSPFFSISWPTGEFGGMGLEGAIKLGFRDELQAIEDPDERMAHYEELVAGMYEKGKAINTASLFELDNVIDPADTRAWLMSGLRSTPPPPKREGKKRPYIDTW